MEHVKLFNVRSPLPRETVTADRQLLQSPFETTDDRVGQWEGFRVVEQDQEPVLQVSPIKSGLQQGALSSSEISSRHNPSCSHTPDSGRHHRRTRLSDSDRKVLEEQFEENPYPDAQRKEELAQCTCLNLKQIQTWFANRRTKARKECNKQRVEAAQSSHIQPMGQQALSTAATMTAGSCPFLGAGSLFICPSVLQSEDACLEPPKAFGNILPEPSQDNQSGNQPTADDNVPETSVLSHDQSSRFVRVFGTVVEKPPLSPTISAS